MKFKIVINARINKDKTSVLYIQYYFNGKRHLLPINLRIEKEYFDQKKQIIKSFHPKSDEYNMIINKSLADCNNILIRAKLAGIIVTPNLIDSEFQNPSSIKEFYPWALQELERMDLAPGTKRAYNSILNKIENFDPGAIFSEIDDLFIQKFDKWLKLNQKNNINTAANAHKRMKTFLKIAKHRKLIIENPYQNFKIKKSNTNNKRIYLTIQERNRLIDLYEHGMITNSEKKVLRGFLFSCFTGLRFSDLTSLRKTNIINDIIVIGMIKTKRTSGEIVKIPLTDYAKKLINDSDIVIYGEIFKHLSEQKTNEKLKKLAIKAKINKKITTHVARHTFATLFFEKTKDVATLQKLLGHSKIEQTMVYAHVSDSIIIEQMNKFNKLS